MMENSEMNKYARILMKNNSKYSEQEAKNIVDVLQTIAHILYQQMLTNTNKIEEQ